MNLMTIDGIDVQEVIANPGAFPEEVVMTVVDAAAKMASQAGEVKRYLEAHVVGKMKHDNATKIIFRDANGEERKATLKKSPMKCDSKTADETYKMFGFDPFEIGDYVFKPSWSKAKEARKFGGEKQQIIDTLFVEGRESLSIE